MSGTLAEWLGLLLTGGAILASVVWSHVSTSERARRLSEDVRGIKRALGLEPGEAATVLLKAAHDEEHERLNERMKALGNRTHDHGNQLANHEGRIASLEQGR